MTGVYLEKSIKKMMGKIKREKNETDSTFNASMSTTPKIIYLKSLELSSLEDLDRVKKEVKSGNIVMLRVTQLAEKNQEDVRRAVNELSEFARQARGDIARLGEDRVIVTPSFVKIWRERTPKPREEESSEVGLPQEHPLP